MFRISFNSTVTSFLFTFLQRKLWAARVLQGMVRVLVLFYEPQMLVKNWVFMLSLKPSEHPDGVAHRVPTWSLGLE
jgi:hypothetical protein